MENMPVLEIQVLKGFSGLPFGSTPDDAVALFGEPEEKEEMKDELINDHSLVFHYWEHGFSLFFNINNSLAFSCAEVDNKEAKLFGEAVFQMKEKEVTELFKKNGYALSESEMHEWGEKRLSFDEAQADLYFENGKLRSVNFGLFPEDPTYVYFPN